MIREDVQDTIMGPRFRNKKEKEKQGHSNVKEHC